MFYFFLLGIIVRRHIISSVTLLVTLFLNWQYRLKFDHKLVPSGGTQTEEDTSRTSEIF